MTPLFQDPGFLGAIVGAVSGLVGALVGGIVTYYASLRQYRVEHATKQNSALNAVLIEICRNQSLLTSELDRALPLWLSRRHESPSVADHLRKITSPLPRCATRVFDAFFTELIPSRYGSELKTYYDRVSYINHLSKSHETGLPAEEFSVYVRMLALAIEVADDVAAELNQYVSKANLKGWGRENDFEAMANERDRALYMAALFRTKLSDLERFIGSRDEGQALPDLIRKKNKHMLNAWVIPARTF